MSPRDPDAGDAFETVEARYAAWSGGNPPPARRSAITVAEVSPAGEKSMGTAIGGGRGLLLLALAGLAAYAASTWADAGRSGATVGYAITAFFLTLAGGGGLLAVWNHVARVIPRDAHPH